MTAALAELLISAVELVEVEGLRLRRRARGLVQSLVMMLVAGGLLLAGAVWLTWATYTALATALSPALSGFIIGGVSLLLAGVFLWLSRQR
jgi:predicted phage tail protein